MDILKQLGVAVLYALLARVFLGYFSSNGVVSVIWPSSGLALAVLLIGGKRYFFGVFLGALMANTTTTLIMNVAIAAGNTLEALVSAWLLTINYRFDTARQSLRNYLRLILAGSIGSIVSALNGATTLLLSGFITSKEYLLNIAHWWMGGTLGITLITPLILTCWLTKNEWRDVKQLAEAVLLLGLTFLAGQIIFLGWFHTILGHAAKGYLMFLFITWVAVRLGVRGTLIALFITATQALLGAYHGVGYFANSIAEDQLLSYWLYMMILTGVGMSLTTFISEIRHMESEKETALHKTEQTQAMLQTVLDSTPDWIFAKDRNYRFLFVNRAFAMSQGCTPQDMVGRPDTDFWSEELCLGDSGFHKDDDAAMAGKLIHNPDDQATSKDGKLHIFDTLKLPLKNNEGHCYGVLGYARDITERKLAGAALLESEQRLQGILNNTSAVIFLKDIDGRYLLVNSRFEKLFHISNAELEGKTDFDIFPKDIANAFIAADKKVIQAGHFLEMEEIVQHDDGIHTYISIKFPLRYTSGEIYAVCGIATDITGRKAAEQQLHDLSKHLLKVREEEKAYIAREIHDTLGSMLAALKIDIYWLLRKLPANDETSVHIERIRSMSKLIDDTVNFTRQIITELRPTILDDLGLLAAIEWQAGNFQTRTGIECRVNCIEDEANLDRQRSIALFRILQESLTNVLRHSGASIVEIEFHHSEKEVILMVKDNGRGILKDHFLTTKSYGMLGMIERMEQLGGRIIFSTPHGGGLRVEAMFPLYLQQDKS